MTTPAVTDTAFEPTPGTLGWSYTVSQTPPMRFDFQGEVAGETRSFVAYFKGDHKELVVEAYVYGSRRQTPVSAAHARAWLEAHPEVVEALRKADETVLAQAAAERAQRRAHWERRTREQLLAAQAALDPVTAIALLKEVEHAPEGPPNVGGKLPLPSFEARRELLAANPVPAVEAPPTPLPVVRLDVPLDERDAVVRGDSYNLLERGLRASVALPLKVGRTLVKLTLTFDLAPGRNGAQPVLAYRDWDIQRKAHSPYGWGWESPTDRQVLSVQAWFEEHPELLPECVAFLLPLVKARLAEMAEFVATKAAAMLADLDAREGHVPYHDVNRVLSPPYSRDGEREEKSRWFRLLP